MNRWTAGIDRFTWPVLGALSLMIAAGCAPEKPSDRAFAEIDVQTGQWSDLDELDDSEAIVVDVGGHQISRREFNRRIDGLVDYAQARLQSEDQRERFLGRIVEFEVMADQGQRQGFGDHPRVRHAIQKTAVELMVEDVVSERVSMVDIDDQARRDYFEENTDEFHRPERRRLAQLVVDGDSDPQRWLEQFDPDIHDPEEAARQFQRSAFQYSDDRRTGDRGGDIGWRTPDEAALFGEDIFQWEFGAVYGPFPQGDRQVWAMVVELEEAHRPPFEQVEQELTERIYEQRRRQARQNWVQQQIDGAEIERFEQRFSTVAPPDEPASTTLGELPRQGDDDLEIFDPN